MTTKPFKVPPAAIAAIQSGKTIAAELGVKVATVRSYIGRLRRDGIIPPLAHQAAQVDEAVIKGYRAGEDLESLAKTLGIGRTTIYDRVDRLVAQGKLTKRGTGPAQSSVVRAFIQKEGIDAAQERWPQLTIRQLQAIAGLDRPKPLVGADVALIDDFLHPEAARYQKIDIVMRIIDGLPEELQKALANEDLGYRIDFWKAPHERGVWVSINHRRFHASQRYIDLVGFEEAFRTILTRETILPAETIAHDNRSFEAETGFTLPPGYTADLGTGEVAIAGDVIAIVERPMPVSDLDDDYLPEPPRPEPFVARPAYVAEIYNRYGFDEVRRRWPDVHEDVLDAAIRAGQRFVQPPFDEPAQPLGIRIWRALKRIFGRG
jgi:biotin operon repressor